MADDGGFTEKFERFSQRVTHAVGRPWAFFIALLVIIVWAVTGPLFGFGDTWQLVINTGTTIVTFLMVFLIQQTQNKDGKAMELKLNELVAATKGASNRLIDVEALSEDELDVLHGYYRQLVELSQRDRDLTESHSLEEAERLHGETERRVTTSQSTAEVILAAITEAVAPGRSLKDVLTKLAETAKQISGASYAAIGIPEPEGDAFSAFIHVGMSDELVAEMGPLPRTHGMLDAMLHDPEPLRLPDIKKDPRFRGWWPRAHPLMSSFLGVPIVSEDEVIGAFYLTDKVGAAEFTDDDQAGIVLLASHAAAAIEAAGMFEDSRTLAMSEERETAGPRAARRSEPVTVQPDPHRQSSLETPGHRSRPCGPGAERDRIALEAGDGRASGGGRRAEDARCRPGRPAPGDTKPRRSAEPGASHRDRSRGRW